MLFTDIKSLQDLVWDHLNLQLTPLTGTGSEYYYLFNGAIKTYTFLDNMRRNPVAVCFNTYEAFVVFDTLGIFNSEDLKEGVLGSEEVIASSASYIDGAEIIATVVSNFQTSRLSIKFDLDLAKQLGFDNTTLKDIENRLILLRKLYLIYGKTPSNSNYSCICTFNSNTSSEHSLNSIHIASGLNITEGVNSSQVRSESIIANNARKTALDKLRKLYLKAYNREDRDSPEVVTILELATKIMVQHKISEHEIDLRDVKK